MTIEEAISAKLNDELSLSHLELIDKTGKHVHHESFDGGHHLTAIIVSDDFSDMPLIERHQLVYKALNTMIKNEIHAFSMKTYTKEEWKSNAS